MEVSPVALPVPLRPTTAGLPKALYGIVRVPVRDPTIVGVNVTPTVQVSPGPTLAPQVLLANAKSPVAAGVETVREVVK
jgi:hypothetical protein